jgi:hypothetical protein
VSLGEGLSRRFPGVLQSVAVHLGRVADSCRGSAASLLERVAESARLAVAAGTQKRSFVQRFRTASDDEWPLERARLAVIPVGLDHLVRESTATPPRPGTEAMRLAQAICTELVETVRNEGRSLGLSTCVESEAALALVPGADESRTATTPDGAAGPTGWNPEISPREQLQVAGDLHVVTGGGTAVVLFPKDTYVTGDELTDLLRFAWHETDVVRVRFARPDASIRQLVASWEGSS